VAETTRPLGVGVVYSQALAGSLATAPNLVDALSLIPEMLWHESPEPPRYRMIDDALEAFQLVAGTAPVVFHGIGLSIGGGLPLDLGHVDQIAALADRCDAAWYSEHLAAFRVGHESGSTAHAGIGLPIPFDAETLREIAPKVSTVIARTGRPFLLENSAIYVEVPDAEMSEATFLNRLADETGSGVLLDLHNLVVNERNLGWDIDAYFEELELDTVVEIHIAGGEMIGDWYTDAHSGACPDRVWELLETVVASTRNLSLVTFEMHESRYAELGDEGLRDQLARARAAVSGRWTHVA
jgi:uncharacterized protein (UPF0276 family)